MPLRILHPAVRPLCRSLERIICQLRQITLVNVRRSPSSLLIRAPQPGTWNREKSNSLRGVSPGYVDRRRALFRVPTRQLRTICCALLLVARCTSHFASESFVTKPILSCRGVRSSAQAADPPKRRASILRQECLLTPDELVLRAPNCLYT